MLWVLKLSFPLNVQTMSKMCHSTEASLMGSYVHKYLESDTLVFVVLPLCDTTVEFKSNNRDVTGVQIFSLAKKKEKKRH